MRRSKHSMPALALCCLTAAACVSQGKYDAALAEAANTRGKLAQREAAAERIQREHEAKLESLQQALLEERVSRVSSEQELDLAGQIALACGAALDESTSINEGLTGSIERLEREVGDLAASKGELAGSLEQARAGLEELRKAQAAADARAALFRDVAERLSRMLGAGELKITPRSGRMVLVLPADIVFDSGKATIGAQGRRGLGEIGAVLATLAGRRFQVSGHTDSDPIRSSGFASNWELSAARALGVVQALIRAGMRPESLSAAGYAEFDPAAANDTPANKAKNRRIEIALQPNIDELITLPGAAGAAAVPPS